MGYVTSKKIVVQISQDTFTELVGRAKVRSCKPIFQELCDTVYVIRNLQPTFHSRFHDWLHSVEASGTQFTLVNCQNNSSSVGRL